MKIRGRPRLIIFSAVPAFVIESDSHDERLFSAERLEDQLSEFMEQHMTHYAERQP